MALLRSLGSKQILTFSPLTTAIIELTRSVGSVTLAICPSSTTSSSFLQIPSPRACGWRLGPCTTEATVESILSVQIPGSTAVACCSSGNSSWILVVDFSALLLICFWYASASALCWLIACTWLIRPSRVLSSPERMGFWSICST